MPSQTTSNRGSTSNYSKPATPYKAIMPPPNNAGEAARKVCAVMSGLTDKELVETKEEFISLLDVRPEAIAEEVEDFQEED